MNARTQAFALASLVAAALWPTGLYAQPLRTVNFSSNPAGAQVRLDANDAPPLPGVTPLRRVRVRQGPHTLYFTLNGYLPGRLDINVSRANESWTGVLTQTGSVLVSCPTEGAQLFLDNQPQGTFPRAEPLANVAPGQHIVEVRAAGMQTFSETITVTAGQQSALRVSLQPPPVQAPTTGSVRVVVLNPSGPLPPDVSISFDGAPLSGTPPTAANVQPGQHIVQVTARGFRTELIRDVTVVAGQTANVPVELHAVQVAPTTGSVQVIVPFPTATVTLDGQSVSGPPFARDNVLPGAHEVRIDSPGHAVLIRSVTVTAGQASALSPAAADFTDLARTGRLSVRASVPTATITLNDRSVGQGVYESANTPAGDLRITVQAPGFQPFSETCNVAPEHPCVITATLSPLAARLNVTRSPAGVPAHIFVDNTDHGELSPNMQLPPGRHLIELRAQGYRPYTQEVELVAGQTQTLNATLGRTTVSTYGAMPLSAGDVAFDLATNYSDIPLHARGTIGLFRSGKIGVDAGFGFATLLSWFEFQPRVRVGYQLAEFFSVGAELRMYLGIGTESGTSGSGISSQVNASFSRAPSSGSDFGAFTFSFHLGVEHNNDSVGNGRKPPSINNYFLCEGSPMAGVDPRVGEMYPPAYPTCVISSTTRGYLGLNAELSVSQNLQVMLGFDYYLAPPNVSTSGARRAITSSFWDVASQAVPRVAFTFRF